MKPVKPIEETWEAVHQGDVHTIQNVAPYKCHKDDCPVEHRAVYFYEEGGETTAERVGLAACAPEALRMLRDHWWNAYDLACNVCRWDEDKDEQHRQHNPDCALVALFHKAGMEVPTR